MNPALALAWLSWGLQRLPSPLLRRLDAWSRQLAVRRAEQRLRRAAARGSPPAKPQR